MKFLFMLKNESYYDFLSYANSLDNMHALYILIVMILQVRKF